MQIDCWHLLHFGQYVFYWARRSNGFDSHTRHYAAWVCWLGRRPSSWAAPFWLSSPHFYEKYLSLRKKIHMALDLDCKNSGHHPDMVGVIFTACDNGKPVKFVVSYSALQDQYGTPDSTQAQLLELFRDNCSIMNVIATKVYKSKTVQSDGRFHIDSSDFWIEINRHCEEQSDAAIQSRRRNWIAALRSQWRSCLAETYLTLNFSPERGGEPPVGW